VEHFSRDDDSLNLARAFVEIARDVREELLFVGERKNEASHASIFAQTIRSGRRRASFDRSAVNSARWIMARRLAPRRRARPRPRGAVQAVVDETVALYHWLAWVADQIYGEDARSAGARWVLRRLRRDGPLTVPALARLRPVRRQSLQGVVTSLSAAGLVELRSNPRHARSQLVALTDRGSDLIDRMDRVDEVVLRAVGRGLAERDLATTAETLRALRTAFETGMRWRPAAKAALERAP
jgi:DNA-binding MarR family transcriptional regulator